jgi:hypothetical protein
VTSSAGILPIDVLCPSLCIQTAMDADVPSCSGGRRRLHSLRHRPTKGRGRGVNEPPNWVSFPNFRNYRTRDGATNRIYSRRDAYKIIQSPGITQRGSMARLMQPTRRRFLARCQGVGTSEAPGRSPPPLRGLECSGGVGCLRTMQKRRLG